MIKKYFYAFVFYMFLFSNAQAFHTSNRQMVEEMGISWESVVSEKADGILPVNDEDGRPFGYARPGINFFQLLCLKDINNTYKKNKEHRVEAIDIGAAVGMMSWKMVAVGAKVTAVELIPSLAVKIPDAIDKYVKSPNKPPLRVAKKDFLLISPQHENHYDIAWAGQNIHFFNPKEIPDYLDKLYSVLKPGGRAYLTSVTASFDVPDVHAFYEARNLKEKFPGFLGKNLIYYSKLVAGPDGKEYYDFEKLNTVWLSPEEDDLHHGQRFYGFCGEVPLSPELTKKLESLSPDEYQEFCMIGHFFDHETFERIFLEAGFIVEEIYYFSQSDIKLPSEFTDAMREKDFWQIGIKVSKPLVARPKPEQKE